MMGDGLKPGAVNHERRMAVSGLDAGAHDRRALAQGGGLRAPRIGTGLDRLADLLRDGVPLGLQPVRLPQQPAAALIERNRGVDRGGVLALVERALAQPRRIVAQALQPDAHAAAPATAPASRIRAATKAGSRLASNQPARGPLRRPRKAR